MTGNKNNVKKYQIENSDDDNLEKDVMDRKEKYRAMRSVMNCLSNQSNKNKLGIFGCLQLLSSSHTDTKFSAVNSLYAFLLISILVFSPLTLPFNCIPNDATITNKL